MKKINVTIKIRLKNINKLHLLEYSTKIFLGNIINSLKIYFIIKNIYFKQY